MGTGSRFKALLNALLRFLRWVGRFNKPESHVNCRGNGWLNVVKK